MHSDSQPEAALQLLQLLQSFPITVRREKHLSAPCCCTESTDRSREFEAPSKLFLEVNTDHPCLLNGVQLLKSFCLGRSWIAYKSSRCITESEAWWREFKPSMQMQNCRCGV